MITYGLALVHSKLGDWNEYEHYLIKAAISDQVCPLKENLALQELALHIFKNQSGEVSRANSYLNYSMEDAQFYNNRLRMLEIAKNSLLSFCLIRSRILSRADDCNGR